MSAHLASSTLRFHSGENTLCTLRTVGLNDSGARLSNLKKSQPCTTAGNQAATPWSLTHTPGRR